MKRIALACCAGTLILAGCSTPDSAMKSVSLFNGVNLDGWVVEHGGNWTVEDGVLVGRNGKGWSTNPEVSGSWLRTAREYSDFLLELDFAIEGNSGVMLRSGLERNPTFNGYEMQILSDYGRTGGKYPTGSLYAVVPAKRNVSKPTGEWNHARILVEGNLIQIVLNGEMVVDYHDATRRAKGYLGLQNHDGKSVVRFRNIRLTEL